MPRCLYFVLLATFAAAGKSAADVTLAGMFGDNCVLQRDMPLPVWGWGNPQEQVTVELNGAKETAQAGADGRWQVTFKPMSAGGPYTLNVTGQKNNLKVNGVLIGEVWIAVGQSNMMMGLNAASGADAALKKLDKYPLLRMGYAFGNTKPEPQKDIGRMGWGPPTGGSCAAGFFFALQLYDYFRGKVPVGVVSFTTIEPAQAYVDPQMIKTNPQAQNWDTGVLYNGVILPVAPYGIRGVLYYQGEMNAGPDAHWKFGAVFPMVIASWRQAFQNPTMPFLFVQLPGYQENLQGTDHKMDMSAADLAKIYGPGRLHGYVGIRQAEMDTLKSVPNTGMAVTIDVGEKWNIHPHDKKTVGDRLFLQARHVAYKDDSVVYSGPIMRSVEFKGAKAIVTFDFIGSKLVSHGDKINGFEIAGPGQDLYPGNATIQGNQVIVTNGHVKEPSMLHYAWSGYPDPPANLYNAEGLPAAPFRYYNYARLQMPDRGEFALTNPNFNPPDGWSLTKGAVMQKSADGSNVVLLPPSAELRQGAGQMSGFNFNSDPLTLPLNVRPGDLLGYSVEMAAGPGQGDANGYFRITTTGGSYLDNPSVTTGSATFVSRSMVLPIDPKTNPGGGDFTMIANVPRSETLSPRPFLVRRYSPITILRPTLRVDGASPIDLGNVAGGASAESKPIVISNSQKDTLPVQVSDQPGPQQAATTLYGLADIPRSEMGEGQSFAGLADNVGAILIGVNAGDFELNSAHATADKQGVRLLGQDGNPGLSGGPSLSGGLSGESETFTVRFRGSPQPGTHTVTLRIVTQAENLGTLSQGNSDEPPFHLYYLDIPVTVTVSGGASTSSTGP